MLYIKYKRQCFIGTSKYRGEKRKYDMQQVIFDQIRGVWIADETLFQVFDIFSQPKHKLKSSEV